jgi:hypothetical protein
MYMDKEEFDATLDAAVDRVETEQREIALLKGMRICLPPKA